MILLYLLILLILIHQWLSLLGICFAALQMRFWVKGFRDSKMSSGLLKWQRMFFFCQKAASGSVGSSPLGWVPGDSLDFGVYSLRLCGLWFTRVLSGRLRLTSARHLPVTRPFHSRTSITSWPELTLDFVLFLFSERGEGREKERERNIDWLPFTCAPTRDGTHNPGTCPDQIWICDVSLWGTMPSQLSHTG